MNLFLNSALSLRRRSVWEAADSGLLLWRSSFIHFIPFFALPVWIAACGLRLLPGNYFSLSYLALWWLKPLFDRLVLHVVSLRFFGNPAPSRFSSLRQGLWGTLRRGLLGDLLWRRFSPGRAARMPIRVLERIGRKQYRLRKKALAAGGLNFCSLVSVLGLALEVILLAGEALFVIMVAQVFFPSALEYMRNNMEIVEIFIFAAFCFNFLLVESLYVCMGFGLYINSRVEVEGWDLQILFQEFAGRVSQGATAQKTSGSGSRLGAAVLLLVLFFVPLQAAAPQEAYAGKTAKGKKSVEFFPKGFPAVNEKTMQDLEEILASPDFGGEKEGWEIRFKDRASPPSRPEVPDEDIVALLMKIKQVLSFLMRGLVVLVIVAVAGFALYWFLKNRRKWNFHLRDRGRSYIKAIKSPESPESLFAGAENFFRLGKLREAWASCFAGCIGACTRYRYLSFPVDSTEYGCLDQVRRDLPAEAGGFGDLVQSWILFAYGGRTPGEGAFEKALAYGRSLLGERVSESKGESKSEGELKPAEAQK